MFKFILPLFLALFLTQACKKKPASSDPQPALETTSELIIKTVFGSEDFELRSIYTRNNGERIKIEDIEFYISNLSLNDVELSPVTLFQWDQTETTIFTSKSVFSNGPLKFNFGLNEVLNHADPTQYPESSPLNILNADDMHWSWSSGYIFLKIEGKVDRTNDGINNFDDNFSYHVSRDVFFQAKDLGTITWSELQESKRTGIILLDLKQLFDASGSEINFDTEIISHSSSGDLSVAEKILNNFLSGMSAQ